jgi:isopropylmalate/homocitrate/citramalate synthase
MIKKIGDLVAEAVQVNTPFNNNIIDLCTFTHKAGIHAKAFINNPASTTRFGQRANKLLQHRQVQGVTTWNYLAPGRLRL